MKAVGYQKSLPIDAAESLVDFEIAKPEPARNAFGVQPQYRHPAPTYPAATGRNTSIP